MKYLVRNKIIILLIAIFATAVYYFKFMNTKVLTKDNNNNNNIDFSNFRGLNMEKSSVKLKFGGSDLVLSLPIYIERSRYYIPVNEVISKIGGEIKIKEDKAYLNLDKTNIIVNIKESNFDKEGNYNKLKKRPILTNNILYISIFDFVKMLNLKTYWDYSNNTICFYKNRDYIVSEKTENNGCQP